MRQDRRKLTEPAISQEGPPPLPPLNPRLGEGCQGVAYLLFSRSEIGLNICKCFLRLLGINLVSIMKTHSTPEGGRQRQQMPFFPNTEVPKLDQTFPRLKSCQSWNFTASPWRIQLCLSALRSSFFETLLLFALWTSLGKRIEGTVTSRGAEQVVSKDSELCRCISFISYRKERWVHV